jgi:site-specific DNA-cytosine methylase
MKLKIFETFSGIGAQHKAFKKINKDFDIVATSE